MEIETDSAARTEAASGSAVADWPARATSISLPVLNDTPPCRGDRAEEQSLLERLLAEQRELTAVEQFSHAADAGRVPAQAKYYRHLLPAQAPKPGQQYAFEVDLDRCSGCKACVTACHTLNGLDDHETWRDVGLLVGGTSAQPVMQHVTTACHHCLEPACLAACPVDAYEKDPLTGIVKHLDDQCFGCQYCTLACPYEVPKYHRDKGIVRKCDMCAGRLAVGEAPACVQACPHEAIAIRVVDVSQVIEDSEADPFLPAAPDPQFTLPATTYKSSRRFPRNLLPADYYSVGVQHPHWPLIVMLVMTQLSVGAFVVGLALEQWIAPGTAAAFRPLHATSALTFGLLALGASTLHLGRPQYAFRAVIGLRHSWLSREIVAFGAFAAAAMLFAGTAWLLPDHQVLGKILGAAVTVTGLGGVLCSVMIYVFTRREYWSFGRTAGKFLLTSALLGAAATWLTLLVFDAASSRGTGTFLPVRVGRMLGHSLVVAAAMKLVIEAALLRHLLDRQNTPLKRSARLLVGPLSNFTGWRFACGVAGGVVMPLLLLGPVGDADLDGRVRHTAAVGVLFLLCLIGELLERYLFFAAVAAPRMPGALRT